MKNKNAITLLLVTSSGKKSKTTGTDIAISLTDFIDFVSKTGSPKMTLVRKIKEREEYHPAQDFYKALREGIIEVHKLGGVKVDLDAVLKALTDLKKIKNYPDAINGYKKFWGKKSFTWFEPPFKHWKTGELDVKINPELGLEHDGNFWIVKLYFKEDPLSKSKAGQILTLMESELRKKTEKEMVFCVLDVKKGKIFINEDRDTSHMPLLKGEAISFETIWKGI